MQVCNTNSSFFDNLDATPYMRLRGQKKKKKTFATINEKRKMSSLCEHFSNKWQHLKMCIFSVDVYFFYTWALLSFLLNRIEKLLEYELKIMTNWTNSIEKKACSVSYITKDCCMLINSLELTEPKNLSEY